MDRGDTGNFLNLPYHGGVRGLRYAIKAGGEAASLESFYSIYDEWVQTREEIENLKIKSAVPVDEAFEHGPPCLNRLAKEGFGEGSRNNALFNVGVYRKKSNPDNWEDMLVADNIKVMDPPLGNAEVQSLIKSLNRKGYDKYRCKEQPICSVCDPAKCRTKKFGVGFEEEQMPELGTLTKISSNPSQYFLDVDGKRVELTKEQLHNPNLFSIEVMDKASVVVPIPKPKDWREVYLKPLMAGIQEIEPLKSSDPTENLISLLQQFTVNRAQARTKEDILNKMSWNDEEGFCYFRMDDFFAYCKRNNWELKRTDTSNLLQQLDKIFVDEVRRDIKNQNVRLIKIKAMKKIEPSVSPIKYEETPF